MSLITKPKLPEMLSSINELVRQDELPWLIEKGSYYTTFGANAEEGTTLRCDHYENGLCVTKIINLKSILLFQEII